MSDLTDWQLGKVKAYCQKCKKSITYEQWMDCPGEGGSFCGSLAKNEVLVEMPDAAVDGLYQYQGGKQ